LHAIALRSPSIHVHGGGARRHPRVCTLPDATADKRLHNFLRPLMTESILRRLYITCPRDRITATKKRLHAKRMALIVDLLVRRPWRYEEVVPNKIFRKP
jgi:hypothetical protein